MGVCLAELPLEVSVKASQQFQDLELIRRSQDGDTEAFDELVTKYRTKVFSIVYGLPTFQIKYLVERIGVLRQLSTCNGFPGGDFQQ